MPISKLEKLLEAETLSERDSYDVGSDDSTQGPAIKRIRGSRKTRRESVKVRERNDGHSLSEQYHHSLYAFCMYFSLVPGTHEKWRSACGTHCLRMRLVSPRCGESGLFSDSSVLCDVRVRTRYSILVRIT